MSLRTHRKTILSTALLFAVVGGLAYWKIAYGVTRTWDGGGVDGTCGGVGTANNWSCAANWSGDTAPTASDIATFDGTSTKNATINANISVAGIDINTGYTGTITQSGSFTVTVGSSHYDQADGTFTGGSGAITVNGAFTLSGGTFTSTTGTLQISAGFTHTAGGTFNHNNGTVTFTGGHTNADVAVSETFYNLTLNKLSGYILTLGSGDTLVVLNTFNQNQGGFNIGTIEVRGNAVIGAAQATNSGTLSFLVAGDQTITSTNGNTGSLNIAKSSGTVSVSGDLTVWGGVTISSGAFTSTTGVLTVAGNWIHTAGGTFNHNNGTVVMTVEFNSYPDVNISETFYNFSKTGTGNLYMVAGDTFIVLGTLAHTDGLLLTGSIEAQGNVIIATTADGGTGALAFTGGNDQTYTDQGGNEPDGDITINKSGGTVTLASNADWNATGQDLTVTAGTLASSTYNLTTTNFTVNGGIFTGGSGALTLNAGNFTLSSGAFTAPSGTLTLTGGSGTFSHSGGTFAHNNGTVVFGGSSVRAIDVPTSEAFNNLTFNNTTNGWDISVGDTLIVLGTLTHTDGAIGNGTVEVRGGVTVASTANGGSAVLSFLISGDQTITGNGGTTCGLNINKPSGTLSAGTTNLAVGSSFTLSSGTFVATSGVLTFSGGAGSDYTHTAGGTFTHNNGTVVFGGPFTKTIDVATNETFYNLGFDNTTNGWTITAGDTLIVLGTLTQTNGFIGGAVEVRGNVIIGAGADGGATGALAFTGGNDQTYTDLGGDEPNGDITINKSGGTVTLASNADWNATNQDLTVTAGLLHIPDPYSLSTTALTIGAAGHFRMSGTGDLTLAGTVSNAGEMSLRSTACGGTDYILVRSSVNGTQRSFTGAGTFTLHDVDVKDMAGTAALTVYSGTNSGNNGANWTFSGASCADLPPAVNIGSGMLNIRSGVVNFR